MATTTVAVIIKENIFCQQQKKEIGMQGNRRPQNLNEKGKKKKRF